MRKGQLFNADICHTLAKLGHTDCIAIGDAGLPIPDNTKRIDIALTQGIPSFLQVFDSITQDMQIEGVILAEEIKSHNINIYKAIRNRIKLLEKTQGNRIKVDFISHENLKIQTSNCKAVIRTGECTAYANIILQSGVIF